LQIACTAVMYESLIIFSLDYYEFTIDDDNSWGYNDMNFDMFDCQNLGRYTTYCEKWSAYLFFNWLCL